MDLYILEEDEYDRYRDQRSFQVFGEADESGKTNPQLTTEVPAGEHMVIFDNAAFTQTEPTGEIEGEYTIEQVF